MKSNLTAGKASVYALTVVTVGALLGYSIAGVLAAKPETVTICHATGLDTTTHFVTLTLPYNAVYGQAGHLNEDGTPQAGHEADYLGACTEPTQSPTPTPTPSLTPLPTLTPTATPTLIPSPTVTVSPTPTEQAGEPTTTPTPTVTPTVTVTPTPTESVASTQSSNTNNNSNNGSSGNNSTQGQVLGASTLAETGSLSEDLIMLGLMLVSTSAYGFKKTLKTAKK